MWKTAIFLCFHSNQYNQQYVASSSRQTRCDNKHDFIIIIIDAITVEYRDIIKRDKMADIPKQEIATELWMAKQVEAGFNDEFMRECEQHGIDPDSLTSKDFLSAASYPAVRQIPPSLTEFDVEFINANVFGQTALLFGRLQTEKLRIQLLMNSCAKRVDALDTIAAELTQKCETLDKLKKTLEEQYGGAKEKETKVADMQRKLDDAESNPTWAAFLRRDQEMEMSTPSLPQRSTNLVNSPHIFSSSAFGGRKSSGSLSAMLGPRSPAPNMYFPFDCLQANRHRPSTSVSYVDKQYKSFVAKVWPGQTLGMFPSTMEESTEAMQNPDISPSIDDIDPIVLETAALLAEDKSHMVEERRGETSG